MKERLVELLQSGRDFADKQCDENACSECPAGKACDVGFIADYLINAGVIVPQCKVGDTTYEIDGEHGIAEVEAAPAVDAVEVVRCEHCDHLIFSGTLLPCCIRHGLREVVNLNDFCSYGERKDLKQEEIKCAREFAKFIRLEEAEIGI